MEPAAHFSQHSLFSGCRHYLQLLQVIFLQSSNQEISQQTSSEDPTNETDLFFFPTLGTNILIIVTIIIQVGTQTKRKKPNSDSAPVLDVHLL